MYSSATIVDGFDHTQTLNSHVKLVNLLHSNPAMDTLKFAITLSLLLRTLDVNNAIKGKLLTGNRTNI